MKKIIKLLLQLLLTVFFILMGIVRLNYTEYAEHMYRFIGINGVQILAVTSIMASILLWFTKTISWGIICGGFIEQFTVHIVPYKRKIIL